MRLEHSRGLVLNLELTAQLASALHNCVQCLLVPPHLTITPLSQGVDIMTEPKPGATRRHFLETTGAVAAASALAGVTVPAVHAAEDNTIRVALVGCGGRGTGAAGDALSTTQGPIKLVAMADVFEDRLCSSYRPVVEGARQEDRRAEGAQVHRLRRLPEGHGLPEAGRRGDPGHAAGLSLGAFHLRDPEGPPHLHGKADHRRRADDPQDARPGRRGQEEEPEGRRRPDVPPLRGARKNCSSRIKDGEIGDMLMLRAYRQTGPGRLGARPRPNPTASASCSYQIQKFHGFLWASGGCFSDFLIHNIDECCWMKDAWPVSAKGSGGRAYRGDCIDQNFDTYSVEYTFADGTKLFLEGRNIDGCAQEFASYAHGSKGSAVISSNSHSPARCRIYKGQKFTRGDVVWAFPQPEPNPYQVEWDDLIHAIKKDKLYNEVKRGAEASLVTAMGRMSAHTGQIITFDEMLNCKSEFAPDVDKLTMTSPAPLQMDKLTKRYPIPQPGIVKDREYLA